jgi:hypothetical protein
MSKKVTEVKTIKLAHAKDSTISVAHIEKPYGEYSSPVVSVAVFVSKEHEYKVHIPYENLDELIAALNKARDLCSNLPHKQLHTKSLDADTGGGQ